MSVLDDIAKVTERIEQLDAEALAAREERLTLFVAARSEDPPVGYAALGNVAGMSDVGVMNVLRRAGRHVPAGGKS